LRSASGKKAAGLRDLDPKYKRLLDEPVTMTLGLIGPDDRIGLTPMWFDYEGDKILVNTASHRHKCEWIRKNPRLTILLVNPNNAYHWVQIKCTVEKEMRGEGTGRRIRNETARPRLDQVHRQAWPLCTARSEDR
jgi:nitroimidazol reductase NimA-like FMN-containing flavoprotein (pyridoxamine 5'-phosphate oxidase superfamily)